MPIEGVRATGPAMDPGSRLPDPAPQTRSDPDPAEFGQPSWVNQGPPVWDPVVGSLRKPGRNSVGFESG